MDAKPQSTRLSVNMNQETADALKLYAQKNNISVTEAVRRIIALAHSIESEMRKGNALIRYSPRTGEECELMFL